MLHSTTCNTGNVLYNLVQYKLVQVQYNLVQYNLVQYNVQRVAVQRVAVPNNPLRPSAPFASKLGGCDRSRNVANNGPVEHWQYS